MSTRLLPWLSQGRANLKTIRLHQRCMAETGLVLDGGESLRRLDQISGKYQKSSVVGTVQFDFPIPGPNYGLADEIFHTVVVRTLIAANGTRLVGVSVDVNYV